MTLRMAMRGLAAGLLVMAAQASAQILPPVGPPEDAFAGGPIKLTRVSTVLLGNAYPHNTIPIIPMPHRARLDTALLAGNAAALEAARKDLADTHGHGAVLVWERTRFLGTGGIGIAVRHARSLAAAGMANTEETVAMLWLYALAASMTDAARCADPGVRDVAIDRLRAPVNQPILTLIRTMPDDALGRAQQTAIGLEAPLAEQRSGDTICGTGQGGSGIRPIEQWRPAAANTRAMLPRHLKAMISVLRPKPG